MKILKLRTQKDLQNWPQLVHAAKLCYELRNGFGFSEAGLLNIYVGQT
jgi:hypothetical protein